MSSLTHIREASQAIRVGLGAYQWSGSTEGRATLWRGRVGTLWPNEALGAGIKPGPLHLYDMHESLRVLELLPARSGGFSFEGQRSTSLELAALEGLFNCAA